MRKIYFQLFALLFSSLLFSQTNVNPLIPYRDGKVWGFCDTLGKVVVKPYFDEVINVRYDAYNVGKASYLIQKNSKEFVVNEKNQIAIPIHHTYDSIRLKEFDIDYIEVFKDGKMGLYSNLKEIIPCNYTAIDVVGNKSYRVFLGDKCGVVNSKNKVVVPIKYDDIYPSWSDINKTNSKFVWEATLGKVSTKFYDAKINTADDDIVGVLMEKTLGNFSENVTSMNSDVLKNYDKVVRDEYRNIAYVTKNNKIGVFSLLEKKLVVDTNYEEVSFADSNKSKLVFKVKANGKFGFVSENNVILLPIDYDKIEYNRKIYQFKIFKNNKVGVKVFNTIYPTIEAKYIEILDYKRMTIKNNWSFVLFLVKTESGIGYVGENGVEYFKN
jgi:hypothetical protein